jgi:hypothetical protein
LRAAAAAVAVAPGSAAAKRNVAHLAAIVAALPADTAAAVKTVLVDGVKELTGGKSAAAYAEAMAGPGEYRP